MSFRPFLFVWTIVTLYLVIMGEASTPSYIKYTTVTGFFLQDEPSTNPGSFDYTAVNFGLIDRPYDTDGEYDPRAEKTQWQRFEHQVFRYNRQSGRNVQYKVIFMGRHGEGYHNVAESFYGTPAWNCYWSEKDGNGTVTWADAHITEAGVKQAQKGNAFWAKELTEQKPQGHAGQSLTIELDRCLSTANITFSGLHLPSKRPFVPEVKELLREAIGIHTCDRRSSKTYIHHTYPTYTFEAGFAENDPLWRPDLRETDPATEARLKTLLDDVFSHDDSTYISFTSHSGAIAAALRAISHRPFSLVTGAVIPVLIKAETVQGSPPSISIPASTGAPSCTANPTPSPTS
ncbi:MAG: hypothetical protein M1835_000554 [Candelina submexicana]|nr:MAG: hypothetical protein M1835_000554 [Candelina submexicana]